MESERAELEGLVRSAAEGLAGADFGSRCESHWLQQKLSVWGSHYGLFAAGAEADAAARIRVAELAANAFEPAGEVAAELGGQLILWLFLFDDAFGEGTLCGPMKHFATLDRFRNIARGVGKASKDCGFERSLQSWLATARRRATDNWAFRLGDDLCGYFDGCLEELPVRRYGRPVPVFRYRELRAGTVGTRPVFAVIELGCGVLSFREALNGDLVELRKRAALLTAWVNDLYSFPKEHAVGDPLNLVAALAHRDRLDPQAAIAKLIDLYNEELETFEELASSVSAAGASIALRKYVSALRHWVHANRWWTGRCGRYAQASEPQQAAAARPARHRQLRLS